MNSYSSPSLSFPIISLYPSPEGILLTRIPHRIILTSSAARVSLAAFCTFFPAFEAAALASAAAADAFLETASLAARAAALASRGEAEPAGAAATDPAGERAAAEEEAEAPAPAFGVSAGVDERDERGVNDFLSDSPSFLRLGAGAVGASDIFLVWFGRVGGEEREVVAEGEGKCLKCF